MNCTAAVITISDKGFAGTRTDTSGPALCAILEEAGWSVVRRTLLPDEAERIRAELIRCADEAGVHLVLTTGGTGFSPRDVTPEATLAVVERPAPGIPEAMRAASMRITPRGCLSRAAAGIRGRTLIVNLPGSEKAARENLLAVLEPIRHGVDMLLSAGSADCAAPTAKKAPPSVDAWLREAKASPESGKIGMFLTHNGVVSPSATRASRGPGRSPAARPCAPFWRRRSGRRAGWRASTMSGPGSTRGSCSRARTSCTCSSAGTSGPTRWTRSSSWWAGSRASA